VLAKGRMFSPHAWTNGIGLLANLHLATGVGGGPYLEYPFDPPGWTPARRDFMLAEPVAVSPEGYLTVGGRPGLGIALDEEALRRHQVS
jgi:D-galactarolactone cycloisomerase